MTTTTILVDLKRCTGCWTCSLACKVGNKLPIDTWWQYVRTIGDGSGIDEPTGVWPDIHMSWMPIYTKNCVLCKGRTSKGEAPYCVYNCPAKALVYGDSDDANGELAQAIARLKDRGYRIFKLPTPEDTRPEIIYADV